MKTLFEAIGYRLGRKAAQAKDAFYLMGGTAEESCQAEIRLGRDLAAALLQRVPLVEENETTRFTVKIGGWLAAGVKDRKLPFSFQVTAEAAPNALALPGGPVFISWPLLQMCQGERDQVAFLLGHEMGHIVLRHSVDRFVKEAALALLLRQSSGRQAASSWLSQAGVKLLSTAYSPEQELAADSFAADLVAKAGGDPLEAEQALATFSHAVSAGSSATTKDYLSSHPPCGERIDNLQRRRLP